MIQPIPTRYAGYHFRSRLEARWAVFFDTLGIEWRYEDQGYQLPSGAAYLPDFYLPQPKLWVEVKGDHDEFLADAARYVEAAYSLDGRGLLLLGDIPDTRKGLPQHYVLASEELPTDEIVLCLHVLWAEWLIPNEDGSHSIACTDVYARRGDTANHGLPPLRGYAKADVTYINPKPAPFTPSDEVEAAYRAARSARFEHGESGAS